MVKKKPFVKEIGLPPSGDFSFWLVVVDDMEDAELTLGAICGDTWSEFGDIPFRPCAFKNYIELNNDYSCLGFFIMIPYNDFSPATIAHECEHIIDYLAQSTGMNFNSPEDGVNELRAYTLSYMINEILAADIELYRISRQARLGEEHSPIINNRIKKALG